MKNKYVIYASDFAPNGTQDVFVADREGNIIDMMSEALFGLHINPNLGVMVDDEQIVTDDELRQELIDMGLADMQTIYKINPAEALRHVAVSPVNDGKETVAFIKKYSKGA